MPINFPNSPSNGDTTTIDGVLYTYDSSNNSWKPSSSTDFSTVTNTPTTVAGYGITDAFDGQYSSLTGAPTTSTAGALGTLTKTFAQNEESEITLSENISPVPNVSVFKEVPQGGLTSKGNWDVNANATNYEFFDEKPISYSSATLTPSATGDGTFTSSNPVVSGYDFTNFAYDSVTQATGRSGNNEAIKFNNDGTKLYLVSDGGPDGVYQYSLSTAYDISTLSYDNVSFSITQDGSPRDISFNADGTKMFILGSNNKTIYRYGLTTGFDLSTASYDNVSLSVNYATASPMGFFFNGNATKLYVIIAGGSNSGDSTVYERQLPGAYDISSATAVSSFNYDESDLPGSLTEAYASRGLFNNDGTKMYLNIQRMPDLSTKAIIEYDLSTAYDLTTISRASIQSLTTGTGNPGDDNRGMAWNGDGTKLITLTEPGNLFRFTSSGSTVFSSTDVGKKVVGNSGSAIITSTAGAYTSVTPFADTSAISSWQLFGAQGKSDGSGIQLSGYGNTYDLSNLSYDSKSYDASGEFPFAEGIAFKSDGTKMYLNGFNTASDQNTNQQIRQYSLSTAYDISTATYDNTYLNVSGQNTRQRDLRFKPDGTILYMIGSTPDGVWQYNLSTAWDLSTASYSNKTINVGTQDTNPAALVLSPDGTKVYVGGYSSKTLYQYNLSTAWDLSTASYSNNSFATTNNFNNAHESLELNSSGSKIFIGSGYLIAEYNMPSDGDVSNVSYVATYDVSNTTVGNKNIGGMAFANNGAKFYIFGNNDMHAYQFSAGSSVYAYSQYSPALTTTGGQINSTSWTDIDSMVADETKNDGDVFYAVSTDDRTSWGVIKDGAGVRKIARNNSGTWQYNNAPGTTVTIGYDLANGSFTTLSSHLSQNEGYQYMHLKPDGTKVWVGGQTSDTIFEYDIGTAFDLSTITYGRSKAFATSTQSRGFFFKPDGTRAYIADRNNYVRQLNMNTAWDISTAQTAYDEYNMNTSTSGIFFKPDGTKFYNIDDGTGRELKQFSMSTAWDITTASLDHTVNLPADQGVSNQGVALAGNDIWFSSDGTNFFLPHGNTGNPVAQNSHIDILKGVAKFSLSTAWDISSTITYLENIKQVDQNGAHLNWTPSAVNFNSDGSKMYTIVSENSSTSPAQRIMEFSTGGTTTSYNTNQTWVDGTNNNEHATLQEALGAQSFNRMDKAQLQAVTDPNHYVLGDTLDLMIAPYATSGTSPLSDGVTIGYEAEALVRQAINGTDYEAEFPALNKVKIKSLASQNLKIRII